jgi:hypothetical protein
MPQSDPSIADRAGIVEFIDQDNPNDPDHHASWWGPE